LNLKGLIKKVASLLN
uniref:Eumenitin-R n=1 Tax=Eumenes rubrofemoratus TaxID=1035770 RepID=EUMER_EUMRB|nr:RecName: Full=Eumenitin-R [Eumenes rubrofemoratus]